VFVDETHMMSDDNSWGEAIEALRAAGAIMFLFTATAIRADGNRLRGFTYTVVSEEDYTFTRVMPGSEPEKIRIQKFEGEKQLVKIDPHHETTFGDAWREDPSPLCKLQLQSVDVDLTKFKLGDQSNVMLSAASETVARQLLGRIARHQFVIEAVVTKFVEALRAYKRVDPTIQGLIFCLR
jgi:hypothetical protein